jgi:hypothetical protein
VGILYGSRVAFLTIRAFGLSFAAVMVLIAMTADAAAGGQAQTPPPGGRGQQPGPPQPGIGRRTGPPQPTQRQGPEYLAGTWQFEWVGREAPVSAGPRSGTVTFTRRNSSNILDMRTEGRLDGGAAYTETGTAEWNESEKILTFRERLATGIELVSPGNWSSPLSIRAESEPARVGGQSVRVRRVYMIVSAQSFTLAEDISIDGGPFQRLGSGEFKKVP